MNWGLGVYRARTPLVRANSYTRWLNEYQAAAEQFKQFANISSSAVSNAANKTSA
jgi:hypothetical protein